MSCEEKWCAWTILSGVPVQRQVRHFKVKKEKNAHVDGQISYSFQHRGFFKAFQIYTFDSEIQGRWWRYLITQEPIFLFLDSRDKNQSKILRAYFSLGVQRLDTLCLRLSQPRLQLTCDIEQKRMQPCIEHIRSNSAFCVLSGSLTHLRCEQGEASAGGIESSCDVQQWCNIKIQHGCSRKSNGDSEIMCRLT